MSSPSPMGGNNQMLDRVIPVVIGCLIALFIFKMLNKINKKILDQKKKDRKCLKKCKKVFTLYYL